MTINITLRRCQDETHDLEIEVAIILHASTLSSIQVSQSTLSALSTTVSSQRQRQIRELGDRNGETFFSQISVSIYRKKCSDWPIPKDEAF